eukprot:RCo031257
MSKWTLKRVEEQFRVLEQRERDFKLQRRKRGIAPAALKRPSSAPANSAAGRSQAVDSGETVLEDATFITGSFRASQDCGPEQGELSASWAASAVGEMKMSGRGADAAALSGGVPADL